MRFKYLMLSSLLTAGVLTSCSDFMDTVDTSNVNKEQVADVLQRSPSAIVYGIYSRMTSYAFDASSHDDFGQRSLDLSVDMMNTDIVHYMNQQWFVFDYNMDNRASNYRRARRQWKYCYANIADANTIINSIPADTNDPTLKALLGEALSLRAHHYFLLVNVFQTAGTWSEVKGKPGVPLYSEFNMDGAPRGTVENVYNQMVSDLDRAIPLLDGFVDSEKGRVTQRVAKQMRARVAMYMEDYSTARTLASEVISGVSLMSPAQYQGGFCRVSMSEATWGQVMTSENSTFYASFFSMMDNFAAGYAGALQQFKCIDRSLYDAMDVNDARKGCFYNGNAEFEAGTRVGSAPYGANAGNKAPYLGAKFIDYKGGFTADYIYTRVAEMYYVKAEAEARLGNETDAKATLDAISNARAINGTHSYTWASGTALLDQIFLHYRMEMWGEGMVQYEYNRLKKTIDRTYSGTNHPIGNILDGGGDRPIEWGNRIRIIQIPNAELEGNPNINEGDQNP
ncbi:MAG: RagB/SusD family nutrient uptake outer membrane protein [Bacteroidales bacterium]